MSMKRILNDIIKEVISANILQAHTDNSQEDIISVLVTKFAEFDVNFDQNQNDTRQFLHSYFDDDNYDNGRSSPIVFYQDDDWSDLIEFYEDEDKNSNNVLRPKSCLKRKNSPPNLNKLKINTVPQVRMIENCLLVDNFYSDDSDFDFDEDPSIESLRTEYKSTFAEYKVPPPAPKTPSPSPKKRSWASVKRDFKKDLYLTSFFVEV